MILNVFRPRDFVPTLDYTLMRTIEFGEGPILRTEFGARYESHALRVIIACAAFPEDMYRFGRSTAARKRY
jgi:hypothetical protein